MRTAAVLLFVLSAALPAGPAAVAHAAACGATGTPTTTVYLPNITKTLGGATGWVTPFIVQNVGASTTTLEVSFYRFSDGSLVTCRSVPGLLPGTSFADVPNNDTDLPGDSQFSVVVRSFGSQVVSVVNEHQGAGERAEALSYVGLAQGSTRVALPYVAKAVGGWTTTFVVQGLESADANVTAAFANADGTRTATLTRRIGPGRSAVVDPGFEATLVGGTEYSVLLTSDQPIAAIVNAHNDAPTVAKPMGFSYNGIALSGTDAVYLPYVARNTDGIARTTRVIVQNAGTADATPSLAFRSSAGVLSTIVAPAAIKPGRSWSFDPTRKADGITACPAAASTGCVGEGEQALAVSGGTFAVLGVTLSPATAMGMAAARPAASRLYLPNITRTLGGTNGWTTPIVLQSAGATSATLRWYRFSDGKLAVTQYVPSLTSGGSVKVDPRSVTGLTDDTQYAVVADFSAPATALVLELNSLGGDAGMSYEGFPATGTLSAAPVPTSITVSPATASVGTGSTQQFTATVKDQSGNAYVGVPITWSVSPTTAATIGSTGLLTAGTAAASATVTARFETLSATAAVTIAPTTVTTGGFTFNVRTSAKADLYVNTTISATDTQTLADLVEPAIAYLETRFGRSFATRPALYAFATQTELSAGWSAVLGASGTPSAAAGVFIPSSGKIGLNWDYMKATKPYRTIRHELTHKLERQLTAGSATVPLWFREGIARMADLTEPGGEWRVMESRYTTASQAATGTLFATSLTDDQFRALGTEAGNVAYTESAETVRLMEVDLGGTTGMTRFLEQIGAGTSFSAAYQAIAARSFDTFLAGRTARLRALATSSPGIVTAPDTAVGQGISFMFHGFTPRASITYTIETSGYLPLTETIAADAYGTYVSYLGATWPKQTYTFRATSGGTTVTTTAVKTTSVDGIAPDAGAQALGAGQLPPVGRVPAAPAE